MTGRLRDHDWPRFLKAPDGQLVARLYEPGLRRALRYDRCCAYFSSSVLAAAASGFGALIERILVGAIREKPPIRLLVNEELSEADVQALLDARDEAPLIATLIARFGSPANALQRRRLEMLAWLAHDGWLEVRVGVVRHGGGILHAKFGLFVDADGDAVVFAGSGNETASGVRGNYEQLEISGSWSDAERAAYYLAEFEALWTGTDPVVATVPLPQAVRDALIKLVPEEPPLIEGEDDRRRQRAAMLWGYALAAPFMPEGGAATCDVMAPVSLWPHQRGVVEETAAAWPSGRLLCDEVGMGKTVEAIVTLRRLLAGRGVRRALILPPANLLEQWQGELREKGGLRVPRLDGPRTLIWPDGRKESVPGLAEALDQDLLLMSRETARTEGNVPVLLAARPWDLVLLDEGHAARRADVEKEGEFNSPTLLLGLLRRMQATEQARSILILSATPMQTHPWEPWDLLQVLGEGGRWVSGFHVVERYYRAVADLQRGVLSRYEALAMSRLLAETPDRPALPEGLDLPPPEQPDTFAQAIRFLPAERRDWAVRWLRACSPLVRRMHRNTRATLRRYYEMRLLDRPPATRVVREDPFDFETVEEREVYDAVETYIDRRFDELERQRPGKGFVMTVYRRRAASSPFALCKSLERRARGLKAVIAQRAYDDTVPDLDDTTELEDLLSIKLTSALPEDPADAASELGQVEELIEKVHALGALDTKRNRIVDWTRRLTADGRSILIFTGYADTMTYLREALTGAVGNAVGSYSGDGGAVRTAGQWAATSKEEVAAALHAGRIKVLVCTDAAELRAETNGLHVVGGGPLRIATHPGAVVDHPEAACVDGLDGRQWALLAQLHRPGERLPLVCAAAEECAFRSVLCAWVDGQGASKIRSFADLRVRVDSWDGTPPSAAASHAAAEALRERAQALVAKAAKGARDKRADVVTRQHEAARLRLVEELGRLLVCFQPDTPDLHGKLYRLATEKTPTASRLRQVIIRLGWVYPDWHDHDIGDLRAFRDGLSANQIKTRLTGRELDAALADPRWP